MNAKDVVAVVTGGASGLGEASITELVKKGARVVIVDIDSDKGEKAGNKYWSRRDICKNKCDQRS